jgi:ketosteroid isomerase-like protein
VFAEEFQQCKKCALTHHAKQKRGRREVRFFEQRLDLSCAPFAMRSSRNYLPDSLILRIEPLVEIELQAVQRRKFRRGSCSEMAFLFYARRIRSRNFDRLSRDKNMGKIFQSVCVLLFVATLATAQQPSMSDEGGRVMALENAWNHALEAKDTKALDMLLANTFVSVDIDGSVSSKSEFLASIKSSNYQPSQAVTEQSTVQVYGDVAVVVGLFRIKGTEKGKPYVNRERFVDTWIKLKGTWQCVATTSTLITAK